MPSRVDQGAADSSLAGSERLHLLLAKDPSLHSALLV